MPRILPCSLVLLLMATFTGCSDDEDDEVEVRLQKVGSPVFEPVDFHKFSARIGTPEDGFAGFFETSESLLPPPKHVAHPALGLGPGAPHAGPYDAELDGNVEQRGFEDQNQFTVAEYTGGEGIFTAWMMVPTANAPNGSSPDAASGRIIPNAVFPITVVTTSVRNGVECFSFPFDVPALSPALDPPFDVQGHSHFPLFSALNGDVDPTDPGPCPAAEGDWEWRFTLRDSGGNGWNITVPYRVRP